MEDQLHNAIVEFLKSGKEPSESSPAVRSSVKNFRRDAKQYALSKERLTRKGKIVIKKSELPELFETYHVGTFHNGTFL